MSDIELNLKRRPGSGNSVKVDGIELGGLVSHIHLDADCTAGPVLRLQMPAIVEFSGTPAALSPEAPLERRVGPGAQED